MMVLYFLKWVIPASFSFTFGLFQHKQLQFLELKNEENDQFSLPYWDSNSQPLGHESPITTRPGPNAK